MLCVADGKRYCAIGAVGDAAQTKLWIGIGFMQPPNSPDE